MDVYKVINEVHKELASRGIAKNDTNTFDKYKFRGIDAVYNTVSPILAKHGLLILQRVLECSTTERVSAKGGVLYFSVVDVEFDLVSSHDGSRHTIKTFGEGMDRSDKSINKALTAAYKYALFQAFCIPTESSDPDLETHEVDHLMGAIQRIMCQPDLAALTAEFKELTKGHNQQSDYVQKLTKAATNRKLEIVNATQR
jgi:hypothetical protein